MGIKKIHIRLTKLNFIICGMFFLLISGCGQNVRENIPLSPIGPESSRILNKHFVLLPFADYSYSKDFDNSYQRNLALLEVFTDQLVAKGFQLPPQEDVFSYLVDNKIIKVVSNDSSELTKHVENELHENWSGVMKGEMSKLISEHHRAASATDTGKNSPLDAPGTHGLTPDAINEIGQFFKADYVMRGRIIDYRIKNETTWNPVKMGFLPFVFGGASRLFFGIADTGSYDSASPVSILDPILGTGSPQAVVQLRAWVQNCKTGEIIWTNRVKVKVATVSAYSDVHQDSLIEPAVFNAVASLVDDFWISYDVL
jgi:hypothetical protein